ncbi:MAG TPA: glycoside hydrolase domain-containing protein [Actinomycetota bacterium]|jgi:Domain of unknown function (DUF1906)
MPAAVDYSFSRPDPACLKRNGVSLVLRYTSIGASGKNLSRAEAHRLLAAGLDLAIVFQESPGHMLGGAAAGRAAARASLGMARAAGAPAGIVHYFALDVDPNGFSAGRWGTVAAYLDAAGAYLRAHGDAAGIYGAFVAIEKMVGVHCHRGWQTYAWSGGRRSGKASLYQFQNDQSMCGGTVDFDRILKRPYGGWKEATQEDPMAQFSEDDIVRLVKKGLNEAAADNTHEFGLIGDRVAWLRHNMPSADEIADAVVARLPVGSGGAGITRQDVELAVRQVLADTSPA